MMGNKKLQVWLPLIFSVIMIVGMIFGYKLGNQGATKRGFFSSRDKNSLQEVLDLIRLKYVDSVNIDSLEGRALQEMMSELDPHSVYFPPVELQEANEDLAGNFEGIGVEFNIYNDTVNVVYVIPDGPSDKAGLRIGDRIIKVEDSILTNRGYDTKQIQKLIRGKRGSKASLSVIRNARPITVTVTRGTIPVPSIDAAYMINASTGYIKLTKFTDNSYEEFMQSMETLKKAGMTSLIYDLRGNGGGFMNEAVDMADEFLSGDKLIVFTQGVNIKKQEYRCKRPGLFEEGKLVIMVDELSASASEVLAGALQDWCRATIVGRRTFGKGLVQQQYELSDGSAIRLTVARYYTPLGRSIQRAYDEGKKVYMDDLWKRFANGEVYSADSIKKHNTGKIFTTSCSDTVYGGDGITPDVFVPLDTSSSLVNTNSVLESSRFSQFVYNYYIRNADEIGQYRNAADYIQRFRIDKMWSEFSGFVKRDSVDLSGISPGTREQLQTRLKAVLARYRWRNSGFYQVINAEDTELVRAVEVVKTLK
jgi:carboxyl-terminal processing protease